MNLFKTIGSISEIRFLTNKEEVILFVLELLGNIWEGHVRE